MTSSWPPRDLEHRAIARPGHDGSSSETFGVISSTDHSDIDRVRDATDLTHLVGEHISLSARGREYVGLCPFHDDSRPSLSVVTHKGQAFYHCFACGASGDCFRFVMDYHKMDFGEALRFLADRAGVTLNPRRSRTGGADDMSGRGPRRADVQKTLAAAEAFFRRSLSDPGRGAAARQAIEARGISAAMVERFALGAAPPGGRALIGALGTSSASLRLCLAAGLVKQRAADAAARRPADGAVDRSSCYDAFRHRLIFPIHDELGRTIAFGGRILDPDDKPKYLNSAETSLFQKSGTLYALHLAKRSIIESRQATVVEGYTDVIACHESGLTNVVGTLGTALTAAHARILARLCDTVVLVFDGDEAGRKAADRAVAVFFAAPVDVRVCVLPEGVDPDDMLKQERGPDAFRRLVDGAVDALEYKLERFERGLGRATGLSARQKHLEAFLGDLADLGFGSVQGVRKRLVLARLSDLLGIPVGDVERALPRRAPARRALSGQGPAAAAGPATPDAPLLLGDEPGPPTSEKRRKAERQLLSLVLFEPSAGLPPLVLPRSDRPRPLAALVVPGDFADPTARAIAEVVIPCLAEGETLTMAALLGRLTPGPASSAAAQLFKDGRARCGDDASQALEHLSEAVSALRGCIDSELYEQQVASFRAGRADRAPAPRRVAAAADGDRRGASGELPGGTVEPPPEDERERASDDLAAVVQQVEQARKQHEHGGRPAAIPRGVRS